MITIGDDGMMIEELKEEGHRIDAMTEEIGIMIDDVIEITTGTETDAMTVDKRVHQEIEVDFEDAVEEMNRRMRASMSGADAMLKEMVLVMMLRKKRKSQISGCLEN
jgi:hypothetical protein